MSKCAIGCTNLKKKNATVLRFEQKTAVAFFRMMMTDRHIA